MKLTHLLLLATIILSCLWFPVSATEDGNYIYWYNTGTDLANEGKYEEALNAINKSLKISPDFVLALTTKAGLLSVLGDYKGSLQVSEHAIAIKPRQAEAWINKANALINLGKYEEALEASEEAIRLDPDNLKAWINKGTALGYLGRYKEELMASEEVLKISPDDERALSNRFYALAMLSEAGEEEGQGQLSNETQDVDKNTTNTVPTPKESPAGLITGIVAMGICSIYFRRSK
ncbi:MAG: tetratricopeptide repeat protein [Methanogenium sp.]|nr:tetratricopeptide repeat protein [Methanogenium sp.]